MTTFKLDENNNIISNSNILLLSDKECLVQDVRNLLLMFYKEYPFNINLGLDYYSLAATNSISSTKNAIIQRLLEDERIQAVQNIEIRRGDKWNYVDVTIVANGGEVINV